MRFLRTTILTAVLTLVATVLLAEKPPYSLGLVVTEYPRHESQASNDETFMEPEEFGKPIGKPFVIETLERWKHGEDRNAIARGTLMIEKAGTYHFRTDSFYDRNLLRVDGETVCAFRDGTTASSSIELKPGRVPIEAVGYVNGRGEQAGILVEWKPPWEREFAPIPPELLGHKKQKGVLPRSPYLPEPVTEIATPAVQVAPIPSGLHADGLTIVAKDFVIEIYHNGRRLKREERRMVLDRFGSTAEKVDIKVKPGDWLVFHVAHNRLRHGGTKYFAVTGHLGEDQVGFVSQADSEEWSVCDDPGRVHDFIHFREAGTEARAREIAKPWEEGKKFMEKYTERRFRGDPIWGNSPSTWIKYGVPE